MNKVKKLAIYCGMALVATPAFAAPNKSDSKRLSESAIVLSELRAAPDSGIPEDLWTKAQCVLVIPSLKKAAFVVGGETGEGVMSCRRANGWSAPIFMHLAKGSVGFQIGAEATDLVLLVMNQEGAGKLLRDKVSLGADLSLAAGPVGRSANAATDAQLNAEMLAYSRSKGLFAGVDLSGGALHPDTEADARVYGSSVSASEVVDGPRQVAVPVVAQSFVRALTRDVAATSGRR